MTSLKNFKKALIDGLVAHLVDGATPLVTRAKIIPLDNAPQTPKPPYVYYGFLSQWKHPGLNSGFNPPTLYRTGTVKTGSPIASGTVTDEVLNSIFDETAEFVDEDSPVSVFQHVKNVTTDEETITTKVVDDHVILLKDHIFKSAGDQYEISLLNTQKVYKKNSIQAVVIALGHTSDERVEQLTDCAMDFFISPNRAKKLLKPTGWTLIDIGEAKPTNYVIAKSRIMRERQLVVTFKGAELITDEVPNIGQTVIDLDHVPPKPPPNLNIIDKPVISGDF